MTRLTVAAAALVAGMTTFAANAQEAPARASAIADAVAAKTAEAGTAIAVRTGRGSALVAVAGETTPAPGKAEPKPKRGKTAETAAKPKVSKKADKAADDAEVTRKPVAAEVYEQGMAYAQVEKQPVKGGAASAVQERGTAFAAEVDQTKTASVGRRKRPELIAVARKSVKGDAGEIVAAAKASGKSSGGNYGALISRYAASYGVPVALAHAVIRVESNYRPNARGKAGEIGLMQIKPATARAMGYSGGAAGLFNPETNIRFGMKYLGMAHQLGGGSTCGTILKYNAGHGARRMNPVSAAYCRKVQRHLGS